MGSSLTRNAPEYADVLTTDRADLDLTNKIKVQDYLQRNKVDTVIIAFVAWAGIEPAT